MFLLAYFVIFAVYVWTSFYVCLHAHVKRKPMKKYFFNKYPQFSAINKEVYGLKLFGAMANKVWKKLFSLFRNNLQILAELRKCSTFSEYKCTCIVKWIYIPFNGATWGTFKLFTWILKPIIFPLFHQALSQSNKNQAYCHRFEASFFPISWASFKKLAKSNDFRHLHGWDYLWQLNYP